MTKYIEVNACKQLGQIVLIGIGLLSPVSHLSAQEVHMLDLNQDSKQDTVVSWSPVTRESALLAPFTFVASDYPKNTLQYPQAMLDTLFGSSVPLAPAEGSLQWIVDVYSNPIQTYQRKPILRKLSFQPRWINGPILLPQDYLYQLPDSLTLVIGQKIESLTAAINPADRQTQFRAQDNTVGFIAYRARWLGIYAGFRLEASTPKVKVYATAHGVVISNGKAHIWVFVSDGLLIKGPDKLRNASIGKVWLTDSFLYLLHSNGYEKQLFMVDYAKGSCYQLNLAYFHQSRKKDVLLAADLADDQLLLWFGQMDNRDQANRVSIGLDKLEKQVEAL